MIAERWEGKIKFLDTDLTADLAEICFSLNESHMALLNMETIKLCAEDTYLCLPFVAVILRLTDIIDFDADLLAEQFGDAQIILSTHEADKSDLLEFKFRQHGREIKKYNMHNHYLVDI